MKRIFFLIAMLAAVPAIMKAADDVLTISTVKSDAHQWELTVQLANPNTSYSGFQIDLLLPDGITLNTASVATSARTGSLTLQAGIASNGLPRIVGYASVKTNSITGTNGTILTAALNVDASLTPGSYGVVAKNIRFTTTDGAETVLPNASCELVIEESPDFKLTYWDGDEQFYSVLLQAGAAIPAIDEPAAREGYSFCGWDGLPDVMPAADVDARAKWCVNSYELKLLVDGEVVFTEQVAYGNRLPAFTPGEIEGYTFCGWNDAPETMPAHDLQLTAKYCVNSYVLKYVVEGDEIFREEIAFGSSIPHIDAPKIDGYKFAGWEGQEYDVMPAKDVVYTARYIQIGDVNLDGDVNTADVVAIYSFIIDGDDSGIEMDNADVNGDGLVNTADVTAVYNIVTNGV
ncbi:MAG: InlB B-repeat-containing protein [Bacteroidaceae bacterium]|nr:InlB B-repeat-containing protein [Bacteroidaceae bacterium]